MPLAEVGSPEYKALIARLNRIGITDPVQQATEVALLDYALAHQLSDADLIAYIGAGSLPGSGGASTDGQIATRDSTQQLGWHWAGPTQPVGTALNQLIITDPQWGAVPGQDCTAAIQKAIDYLDQWDPVAKNWKSTGSGKHGGVIFFPASSQPYKISACLVSEARIKLIGQSGATYGGPASIIQAQPGGTYTNTNCPTGSQYGLSIGNPWMLRLSRNNEANAYSWWHAGSIENIQFDANGVYVGGVVGMGAGEVSVIDLVQIENTGIQARTVTDAFLTAGSPTVTSNTANFDVLEDMAAAVTSTAIPAWNADQTINDAAISGPGVAVVTSPSNAFANVQVGMEVAGGNSGLLMTNYVLSKQSSGQITMAYPLDVRFSSGGTGLQLILGQPRDYRIEQVIDSKTIKLNRALPVGATAANLVINRARPGMRWHGGEATGNLRSVNTSSNSGAGVEYVSGAPNIIQALSGDNNGGALLRIHKAGTGDQVGCAIGTLKAENNNYGNTTPQRFQNYADHDPVILLDYCGMVDVEIQSGNVHAGDRGNRDVIRIQQAGPWQNGYPSIGTHGLEANDPWNVSFDNLIRDVDSGQLVLSGTIYAPTYGGRFYPDLRWNKDEVRYGDSYLRKVPATGLGGNLSVDGSSTFNGPVVFNGGTSNLYSTPLDLSATTGTSVAPGTALGDKLSLFANQFGLGIQGNRLVAYVAANNTAFGVRIAANSGQKSSGADAVLLWGSGVIQALGSIVPGNGSAALGAGCQIFSGTAAPALSANLGDVYIRRQQPTWRQAIYLCTTASSATAGAWTAFEDIIGPNLAPDSWEILGWKSPPILTSGTWQSAYIGNQVLTHIGYNLSNAQNNEYRWMANLAKGTYRFDLITDKGVDRAIETWEMSFDGGTTWTGGTNGLAIGTFDLYAAAAAQNNMVSASGLVIPQTGPLLIRVRNPTRNASNTTGWTITVTQASLQRTA